MTAPDTLISVARTRQSASSRWRSAIFIALLCLIFLPVWHEAQASPPATGPWVVKILPGPSVDAPFDLIGIRFNDEIINFTIDDVAVSGGGGGGCFIGITER